jgi:hypothetical protein
MLIGFIAMPPVRPDLAGAPTNRRGRESREFHETLRSLNLPFRGSGDEMSL